MARKKGLTSVLCPEIIGRLSKGETLTSIAAGFGVVRSSISRLLGRHGYVVDTGVSPHPSWASEYKLTPRQRSVLLGDMFGDGGLVGTSQGSAYYACAHSRKQESFVIWKFNELNPLSARMHYGDMPGRIDRSKRIDHVSMATWTNCQLGDWRSRFYPSGKGLKVLDPRLIGDMDELGLAVWYFGDGSKARRKAYITVGLDQDGPGLIVALDAKFGQGLFVEDPERFFAMVLPHVFPGMEYKVPDCWRH